VSVPMPSRQNRMLLVLALLGPVTLGLALGAILMRFAAQPELVRAAEPSQPAPAPVVAPAVAPVAPGVPAASSVSAAPSAPLEVALHAAPAERKLPEVRAPAGAVTPSAPTGVPGTGVQAVPTAQPRHKREPMRPPSAAGKARPTGSMSDKEFDQALGFGSSP
jgi:hypothetical protein